MPGVKERHRSSNNAERKFIEMGQRSSLIGQRSEIQIASEEQPYGAEVPQNKIAMKRRSGTAQNFSVENQPVKIKSSEKRLKLSKHDRANTHGNQQKPPKPMNTKLSPEKVAAKMTSPANAKAQLPRNLSTDRSHDGGAIDAGAHEMVGEQQLAAPVSVADISAPVTTIAQSHQVNDQFIDNIRAKLDMLDQI